MSVTNDNPLNPTSPFRQSPGEVSNKKEDLQAFLKAKIPDSTVSSFQAPTEPISGKLLDVSHLEIQKKDLSNLFEKAESLDVTQSHDFQKIIYQISQEQVGKILKRTHENKEEMIDGDRKINHLSENALPLEEGAAIADFIPEYQLDPSVLSFGEKMEPIVVEEAFAKYFPGFEIGVVGANVLSRGCITFASGMILNQIEEVVKAKEKSLEFAEGKQKAVLINEIVILKKWLSVQTELFNALLTDSLIMSITSLPKAGSAVGAIIESGTKAAEQAALAVGNATLASASAAALNSLSSAMLVVDAIGMGATMIRNSIALKEATDDVSKHKAWSDAIVSRGPLCGAKFIYERQKEIYQKRCELNLPVLNTTLNSASFILEGIKIAAPENQAKVIANLKKQLLDQGIDIPLENPTAKELQAYLLDSKNHNSFNSMMVKKKEEIAVSVRNALKTLSNHKANIDKGFLSLALTRARAVFTTALVVTTAVIVLKILVLAGVIASSAAISATGFGVLAVIVGFMIFGAVYLYMKKPNIFKTYLQAVQARLFFWKLPLAVQKYRLNYSILETKKISEQINELGLRVLEIEKLLEKGTNSQIKNYTQEYFKDVAQVVPGYEGPESIDEQKEVLRKYQSELKVLKESKEEQAKEMEKQSANLKGSVEYFEEKVKVLQDRVDIAGWKDFQKELKGKEQAETQSIQEMHASKENKAQNEANEEDYETLAGFLLKDPMFMEDKETKNLFSHMGIDRAQLQNVNHETFKQEVGQLIRGFFAMETEDTVRLLNKRELLTKHGLIEKYEHPLSRDAKQKLDEDQQKQIGKNGLREDIVFG